MRQMVKRQLDEIWNERCCLAVLAREDDRGGGSLIRREMLQKQFQHLYILQNFPNSLFRGVHLLTRRFLKYITKHNFICISWRDFLLKKKKRITNQFSLQEARKKRKREIKMRHIKNYINLTILTITLTVMVKTIEWQILLE